MKTYLLLKPPFLSEEGVFEDNVLSIQDAAPYSDTISVNLIHIQNFAFVRFLWKEGLYKSPQLGTLLRCWMRLSVGALKTPIKRELPIF